MERQKRDYDAPEEREMSFDEPDLYGEVERKETCGQKRRTGNKVVLLILFVLFGLPLAGTLLSAGASVISAIFGIFLGIIGGMLGLVAGGFALVLGLVVAGIALIISGCINMSALPAGIALIISGCINMSALPAGMMLTGGGFFALSAAMLTAVVTKWGCTTVVPGLVRFCVELVRSGIGWTVSTVHSLGRGGRG